MDPVVELVGSHQDDGKRGPWRLDLKSGNVLLSDDVINALSKVKFFRFLRSPYCFQAKHLTHLDLSSARLADKSVQKLSVVLQVRPILRSFDRLS